MLWTIAAVLWALFPGPALVQESGAEALSAERTELRVDTWPDGTVASRYGFLHALYRETLYERVPVGRRVRWHQQIGRRLEVGYEPQARERAAELAEHATDDALSPREVDVLKLIAGGNANKAIAGQLSITEETVKGHVKNILAKLAASDRTHAVTIALKRGIIDL